MNTLQEVQKKAIKKVPTFKVGSTLKIHQKIKEGEKQRIQIFEGLVIAIGSGHAADKTFTVRKVVEGIGVEKIFPLHSPNISKIEVTKQSKIRRAKLYYMRELTGKAARMKESFVSPQEYEEAVEELAEKVAEEEAQAEAALEEAPMTEEASAAAQEETPVAEETPTTEEEAK